MTPYRGPTRRDRTRSVDSLLGRHGFVARAASTRDRLIPFSYRKHRADRLRSDGVVPYWSSHLDGAASEKIVPSSHGSHRHPEGIEELRRILLLHLEEGD